MEFEHQGHWAVYRAVRERLEDELAEYVSAPEEDPVFFVEIGEVPVLVSVQASGPKASVTIYAKLASGLEVTPEVARFLLHANFGHDVPFGALGLNDEEDISFSHVLMGEGLDLDGFILLLHLVASKLDVLDQALAEFRD